MGGFISKKADLADADTGDGWKCYLTTEQQECVLHEARSIKQGYQPQCHNKREGSAIFWASISRYSLQCKLAELLAALEDGADPNEQESEPIVQLRSGRPLDLCLDESKADFGEESILNNIPVIQMLLDYGADPRLDPIPQLKGKPPCPLQPVEEARRRAGVTKGPVKEFYKEAYVILKKAADRLDTLDGMTCHEKFTPRLDGTSPRPGEGTAGRSRSGEEARPG